jgi:tetratricopeptide (TPR) repeat protein
LLKSRLLADGGLYNEALMALQNNEYQLRDRYDSTEWHYRRGRAFQGLNRITEAIACFEQTIVLGLKLSEYFAASAALQAGILLKETNPSLARNYWRKVSRFPNHPYKKSLDAKAEAFLSL